jgi:hypothetical protein
MNSQDHLNSSGLDVHRTSNNAQDHLHYSGQDVNGDFGFVNGSLDDDTGNEMENVPSPSSGLDAIWNGVCNADPENGSGPYLASTGVDAMDEAVDFHCSESRLDSAEEACEAALAVDRAARLEECRVFEAQRVDDHAGPLNVFRVVEDTCNPTAVVGTVGGPELEAAYDPEVLQDMIDMVADGMTVSWPEGIDQLTASQFLARRRDG